MVIILSGNQTLHQTRGGSILTQHGHTPTRATTRFATAEEVIDALTNRTYGSATPPP